MSQASFPLFPIPQQHTTVTYSNILNTVTISCDHLPLQPLRVRNCLEMWPKEVCEEYCWEIKNEYPVLCLYNNHWKANVLTTTIYSQLYKTYNKKMNPNLNNNNSNDSKDSNSNDNAGDRFNRLPRKMSGADLRAPLFGLLTHSHCL